MFAYVTAWALSPRLRGSGEKTQFSYLMCTPEMARAMIRRWISEVPSKMV